MVAKWLVVAMALDQGPAYEVHAPRVGFGPAFEKRCDGSIDLSAKPLRTGI